MIEESARRLGVSEVALRMSVDAIEPHPTLEVIVAVVKYYGVDPAWLVSGEYDSGTHRAAVDDDNALSQTELTRLVASRLAPTRAPAQTDPRPPHRLEA